MDIPFWRRCFSHFIDQVKYVNRVPDSLFRGLALSTAISHAGNWLVVVPSHALGLGLGVPPMPPVLVGADNGGDWS